MFPIIVEDELNLGPSHQRHDLPFQGHPHEARLRVHLDRCRIGLHALSFWHRESLRTHQLTQVVCDLRVTQQLTRRRGNCLSVSVSSSTDEAGLPHHTHSHVHRTVQLRFYLRLLRPTLLAFTSLMPRQSDLAITPSNHTWQSDRPTLIAIPRGIEFLL